MQTKIRSVTQRRRRCKISKSTIRKIKQRDFRRGRKEKLEKENEEVETLVKENMKEEFDSSVQSNENEGEIAGVSPILRVREDIIISSKLLSLSLYTRKFVITQEDLILEYYLVVLILIFFQDFKALMKEQCCPHVRYKTKTLLRKYCSKLVYDLINSRKFKNDQKRARTLTSHDYRFALQGDNLH